MIDEHLIPVLRMALQLVAYTSCHTLLALLLGCNACYSMLTYWPVQEHAVVDWLAISTHNSTPSNNICETPGPGIRQLTSTACCDHCPCVYVTILNPNLGHSPFGSKGRDAHKSKAWQDAVWMDIYAAIDLLLDQMTELLQTSPRNMGQVLRQLAELQAGMPGRLETTVATL